MPESAWFRLIVIIAAFPMAAVIYGFILGFAVWIYPHAPWIIVIISYLIALSLVIVVLNVLLLGFQSNNPDRNKAIFGSIFFVFFAWMAGNYIVFMGEALRIELPQAQVDIFLFVQRCLDVVRTALVDILGAWFGARFDMPDIGPPPVAASVRPDTSAIGASIRWIGESFWSILLGVVSSAIFALMARSRPV